MAEGSNRPHTARRGRRGTLALLGVLVLLVAGFGLWARSQQAVAEGEGSLLIAAAADLRFAFEELGPLFQEETGNRVRFTFGSTGNLTQQVISGAPVDVFAAANVGYLDALRARGLILEDTQQLYGMGRLVLAVNRKRGLKVTELKDLLQPRIKRVAIANPEHAPYGQAAKEVLVSAGLWEDLQPKLVYGENVRQTLQHIQTGNAEAGIVALSIANVPEIAYQLIDEVLHEPLQQAVAVIRGTRQEVAARQFVAFLNGPQGRAVMKRYGFLLPGE